MKTKFSLAAILGCFLALTQLSYALEPLPAKLINFSSPQGVKLFKANLTPNALKLLANFTTQQTLTYCGVASAVMVLNSSTVKPPLDSAHAPYAYFTQDNFFSDAVKKVVTPEQVQKAGMDLNTFNNALQASGLKTKMYYANQSSLSAFRKTLKEALKQNHFVIVNFLRTALQQQGAGHFSPVAAYDNTTDSFLLLDVARYKYPAYWVKTADLWSSVNTQSENLYRGFILIF